jgi:hypothetical protein
MPLRPTRAARRGVVRAPVARAVVTARTAAAVAAGVNRLHDRRRTARPGAVT